MLRQADPARTLRPNLARMGVLYRRTLERVVVRRSLIARGPVIDRTRFPWTRVLEKSWRGVRAELDRLLEHRDELPSLLALSPEQSIVTRDDRWRTLFLHAFGRKLDATCAPCPETTRLVEAVPGMRSAFFSLLAPGKRIPAHRGPWSGIMRYHLGLLVPETHERCAIRIGGQRVHWHEGEGLLFDDSIEHEVWNDTAEWRVVLALDVIRPLAEPFGTLNRWFVDHVNAMPIFAALAARHERWEREVAAGWDLPSAPARSPE